MKIIMVKEYRKLGKSGDVVEAKDGYARNFLIPRGFAIAATKDNFQKLEELRVRESKALKKKEEQAVLVKEQIEKLSLTMTMEAKEDDELYGSVSISQIVKGLREENIEVDENAIVSSEPIRKLGVYNVTVKLHPAVTANLRIWIVKK